MMIMMMMKRRGNGTGRGINEGARSRRESEFRRFWESFSGTAMIQFVLLSLMMMMV